MVSEEAKALPVVVLAEDGSVLDVARMNSKGYDKSRENGALWTLHGTTGRLLPHPVGAELLGVRKREGWYEAVVAGEGRRAKAESANGRKPKALREGKPGRTEADDVLGSLSALVLERKRELPEGSYTAYLFKAGIDKIRKKTGEEAVEVILARGRERIVAESADLIYHLLVLLAAEGIGIEKVLGELSGRPG